MSTKLVTALFHSRMAANNAYDALIANGFTREDVSVLMSQSTRTKEFGVVEHTKASQGAVVGAAAGGLTGATLAALAAGATLIVPAIGLVPGVGFVVAGPMLVALAGAGVGGATGGLVGALIGAGIPEHEAKFLNRGLEEGGILIGVQARAENVPLAKSLLGRFGGESLKAA